MDVDCVLRVSGAGPDLDYRFEEVSAPKKNGFFSMTLW